MTTQAARKALAAELAGQGYYLTINSWPARALYYKPDGTPMPNLPADPDSMQKYMKRGFTLVPPTHPVATTVVASTVAAPPAIKQHVCANCGAKVRSAFALAGHRRTHQKENGNVLS